LDNIQETYDKWTFLFLSLHWTMSRGEYCEINILDCTVCPLVKETQLFIPLLHSRYSFPLTKSRPYSKPHFFLKRNTIKLWVHRSQEMNGWLKKSDAFFSFCSARSKYAMGTALW